MKDKLTGEPVAVKFIERGEKVRGVSLLVAIKDVVSEMGCKWCNYTSQKRLTYWQFHSFA